MFNFAQNLIKIKNSVNLSSENNLRTKEKKISKK